MEIRVLGDLEVTEEGATLSIGGPKPRALVGLLVAARGRTVTVERIIDQIWKDDPPPKVLGALQGYVSKLRRELEPDRDPRSSAEVLLTRPSGYALGTVDGGVDADEFEELVRLAGAATPHEAELLLSRALGLWRGPAYAGLDHVPALAAEARRLDELRLVAWEQRSLLRLTSGDADSAIADLRVMVAEHPERERSWALLAAALYRSARQGEALEVLREVRGRLAEELGVDPGPLLQEVEAAVLRQEDGHLEQLLLTNAPSLAPSSATSFTSTPNTGADPVPAPQGSRTADLVGRADALDVAHRMLSQAAQGRGGVLLVLGEPGVGKSTFARAVGEAAEAAGTRVARGSWEQDGCPPLWAWSQVLADRAAEVMWRGHVDEDVATATYRFADGAARVLAERPGSCVLLDDIQWADADSHRILRRIAEVVRDLPVLLVLTCRDPHEDETGETQRTLAALARGPVARVALGGLEAPEVQELVLRRTGIEIDDAVASALQVRTSGNPFYVGEMVSSLTQAGALSDQRHPEWDRIPLGVRDTIRHRVADLDTDAQALLARAAVLGRTMDVDVLQACWDATPEALEAAYDASTAAGLLIQDQGQVAFAHGLVRDAVYAEVPPITAQRWHATAAYAYERVKAHALDEHAATIAEHYRKAGPAHARAAWTYAERAAGVASASGAHADAARMLDGAAQLQAADVLCTPAERERLQRGRGMALIAAGRVAEAWAPLQEAAQSALDRGDFGVAATTLLGITRNVMWSWRTLQMAHESAVDLWLEVLERQPLADRGTRARILAALAVEVMHDPAGGRCTRWIEEALALSRDCDESTRAEVLQVLANAMRRPEFVPQRAAACDELVALCARARDERGLAAALCKRALNHSAFGRSDAALVDLERALELASRHRLATVGFVTRLGLAVTSQAMGRFEESEEHIVAAEKIQVNISMAGGGVGACLRYSAAYSQGRYDEAAAHLEAALRLHPSMTSLHALAQAARGDEAAARASVGSWHEQPELTWDYLWVTGTVIRAHLWSRLGDQDAIASLRDQLTPYADRVADGATSACFFGSVHHALALLEQAAGRDAEALAQAQAALAMHERAGWPLWAAASRALVASLMRGSAPAGSTGW